VLKGLERYPLTLENPATMSTDAYQKKLVERRYKMLHEVTFQNAELASLKVKTAKNGNHYANGIMILRNEEGKFQASMPFITFTAVEPLAKLLEATPRVAGAEDKRPMATVSGWFRTSQTPDKVWLTNFNINSVA